MARTCRFGLLLKVPMALAEKPGEVISHLDEAIDDLANAIHLGRSALTLAA